MVYVDCMWRLIMCLFSQKQATVTVALAFFRFFYILTVQRFYPNKSAVCYTPAAKLFCDDVVPFATTRRHVSHGSTFLITVKLWDCAVVTFSSLVRSATPLGVVLPCPLFTLLHWHHLSLYTYVPDPPLPCPLPHCPPLFSVISYCCRSLWSQCSVSCVFFCCLLCFFLFI